jgi:hypothetical protein
VEEIHSEITMNRSMRIGSIKGRNRKKEKRKEMAISIREMNR